MNPLILIFLAPLGLLVAALTWFGSNDGEAAKAAARARTPTAIRIEDFQRDRDVGPADEVMVLAQVDLTRLSDLVFTKNGDERDRYALAPLYPTDAKDVSGPAYGLITERDQLTNDQIKRMIVGQGPIGPVIRLDGELVSAAMVSKALSSDYGQSLRLTRIPLYIDPYERGRAAALAPSNGGHEAATFIAGLSLAIGALGAFLQWRRVKRRREETDGYYGTSY